MNELELLLAVVAVNAAVLVVAFLAAYGLNRLVRQPPAAPRPVGPVVGEGQTQ